jgi:hypothetical protein
MRNCFYLLLSVGLALSSSAAYAADDFITGVYLETEKLCADARKDSLQKVIEEGNLILSERGFDSIEYNCAFVQIAKHPRQPKAWLVTALCEEPGLMAPDVFSIIERQAGQLEVVSMEDDDDGEEDGLSGTYHYCEGVKLP